MGKEYERERILKLAEDHENNWIRQTGAVRPEVIWIQEKFAEIKKKYRLNSQRETDLHVYKHMYNRHPEKSTEYLKIRYWRTGRYTPSNRMTCLKLAQALELSEIEKKFLLQGYYDSCDTVYTDSVSAAKTDPIYLNRYRHMNKLICEYLEQIPADAMKRHRIDPVERSHYFRHLYYTDAFHYVHVSNSMNTEILRKHITSTHYDSELRRQMKLEGEIPRKTMLRHLLILNAPKLSVEKISRQLSDFGYLPLNENHTLTGGEYLDRLILSLLELYEEIYVPGEPEAGLQWFQQACRTLDEYFAEKKYPKMRFMYFKALGF